MSEISDRYAVKLNSNTLLAKYNSNKLYKFVYSNKLLA